MKTTATPLLTPLAPGELLARLLKKRDMTQSELATLIGKPPQYVNDIIKRKKAIDARVALELEEALDEPKAQRWMIYELTYQRHLLQGERDAGPVPTTRKTLFDDFSFAPEAIKLGWIEDTSNTADLARRVRTFWADATVVRGHFKQSQKLNALEQSVTAWHIQVYREAMQQPVPKYDPDRFSDLLTALQACLIHERDVRDVPALLRRYGIRFVTVPHLKKCPVDGVASYNHGMPYVGMSLRHAKLDNFWFALLHEVAHIYHQHDDVVADNFDRRDSDKNADERQADATASKWILDESAFQEFQFRGRFTLEAIQRFAEQEGVHPAIVIGRLKHTGSLEWSRFSREHPNVREMLSAPSS